MKYARKLGLLAVAATALMAFAGSASATTLTSPGGQVIGKGSEINAYAEAPHIRLESTIKLTCTSSVIEGKVTDAHGSPFVITVENLTLTNCGANTVTIVDDKEGNNGTLTINSANEVFSTGAEVTALTHNILGTVHCIFKTNTTKVATLTEGSPGTLDFSSAGIPRVTTDGACKSDAVWTGNYIMSRPEGHLTVD